MAIHRKGTHKAPTKTTPKPSKAYPSKRPPMKYDRKMGESGSTSPTPNPWS